MSVHFIQKCKGCRKAISQCRCPSPDKMLIYGICSDCRTKYIEAAKSADNPVHPWPPSPTGSPAPPPPPPVPATEQPITLEAALVVIAKQAIQIHNLQMLRKESDDLISRYSIALAEAEKK